VRTAGRQPFPDPREEPSITWIRRVRLAAAGAVALTAITVATAGATGATDRTADAAPRTPAPGFLLEGGRFTVPDATVGTSPGGIDNRGQITGGSASDVNSAATAASAFVLRKGLKGPISPIAVPGAAATFAGGINDLGQIVGAYRTPPTTMPLR
jgi:hypothetical protein